MAFDQAQRARQNSYQDTVIHFINKDKGHILTVSDDQAFCTQLRLTLARELGLADAGCLTLLTGPSQLVRRLRELESAYPVILLFLERALAGQDQSLLVKHLHQTFPGLKIIILTTEVPRERLLLLHELGADNVIAKPVSANTLIEKMAFTIRPQSRIGKAIDLARALLEQKKYAETLDACAKILTLKPGSAAAYLLMGDAYRETGAYDKARTAYETAASGADLYLAPLQRLAELYEATGDKARLKECLERLDALSPLNVDRKVSLGSVNLELGNTEKAEEYFDKAVVQMQHDALDGLSALSGRIADIYTDRDPGKAEKYLRNSLEIKKKISFAQRHCPLQPPGPQPAPPGPLAGRRDRIPPRPQAGPGRRQPVLQSGHGPGRRPRLSPGQGPYAQSPGAQPPAAPHRSHHRLQLRGRLPSDRGPRPRRGLFSPGAGAGAGLQSRPGGPCPLRRVAAAHSRQMPAAAAKQPRQRQVGRLLPRLRRCGGQTLRNR